MELLLGSTRGAGTMEEVVRLVNGVPEESLR